MTDRDAIYFDDVFADLAFLHTLTLHGFGGSEIGEAYLAAAKVDTKDPGTWAAAWREQGERAEKLAREADAQGHHVTARMAYLRAVTYYRNATMAISVTDPQYRQLIEHYRELFRRFGELSDPPIEYVEIPYGDDRLPAYFVPPNHQDTAKPTVVIGDNISEELYYWIAPAAIARGYNALLVDIPGIGLNAFRGLRFEPHTENSVSTAIDYLLTRSDVDNDRIAVYGGGEPGGYIMSRAAAHDSRIAACILDPLVANVDAINTLLARPDVGATNRPVGHGRSIGEIFAELAQLQYSPTGEGLIPSTSSDSELLTCPLLCLNIESDPEELKQAARARVAASPSSRSRQHTATREDGTLGYRHLDNFGLKHRLMFDWFDDVLGVSHV